MTTKLDHLGHEAAFRGDEIISRRHDFSILMCGAGALGSWLLDLLARQGFHKITILDRDKVEAKNFGTQNFSQEDIGRQKATQSKNKLYRRLKIAVESVDKELTVINAKKLIAGHSLVLDLFDNYESRNILASASRELKIPCMHVGMHQSGYSESRWDTERYVAKPALSKNTALDPCEYPLASNLVQLTVGMAAESVCRFVDQNIREDFCLTLKDLNIDRQISAV